MNGKWGRVHFFHGAVNRGWPLGGQRFKDQIEAALQCAARPPMRGRPSMPRRQASLPAD